MESVLHTDTIYAGEVNLMSYMGIWRTLRGSDSGQEALAGRIAYALADMNGNIVQIYPPFRQDTSGAVPWNLPVYVDLPEGDYIQKILLNIPEDPDKWYDLRMRDDFNHYNISRANDYVDRSLEWTKYLPIFHGTAPNGWYENQRLPRKYIFWNEKTITRHVVARKSLEQSPIPSWDNPHFFRADGSEIRYGGLANIFLPYNSDFTAKLRLSNKSNAYRKGTLHAVVVRNNWVAQNFDILEALVKALEEEDYGIKRINPNTENAFIEVGNTEIIFRG